MNDYYLIFILVFSIVFIVVAITRLKIHAFLALILACFIVSLATKTPLSNIASLIEKGVGGTLGFLSIIIACGAILGKMLEISNGAQKIASTLINALGRKRANIAMALVGFIAGIPVFVEVGFVLLVPLVFVVSKSLGISHLRLGMALATSLMVVHCIVPPHPAASAIVAMLNADMGSVIALGLGVGLVLAFVGGVVLINFLSPKDDLVQNKSSKDKIDIVDSTNAPSAKVAFFVVLLPLVLMLLKTLPFLKSYEFVIFLSNPIIALVLSVFVAYFLLGLNRGISMQEISSHTSDCFMAIASVLLIIGAGGAFNEVLIASGIGEALKNILRSLNLNPIFLAWLIALILHSAVGSATVAMISAAGIVLPLLEGSGVSREVVALAIGSGAIGLTIVTDSLFWLIKESLGMSVKDMFKYYTSATSLCSVLGLALALLLSQIL